MQTIKRSDIPHDFTYYRTGSRVFYEYYKKYTKMLICRIGTGYEFIKAGKLFWNTYAVNAEKIDQEPTAQMLRWLGMRHGVVFWWPLRTMGRPKWWIRIPTFLAKESFHASRSAFSTLDRPDYYNKWKPAARAHRRKIHRLMESGVLRIEKVPDLDTFLAIYKKTEVPDPYKPYIIEWSEQARDLLTDDNSRIYIAYVHDQPLAGAVFIDERVTSEYFTSFYAKESHPWHLGIALMDRWFRDSYEKWMKYCDLDHMYEPGQTTNGNTKGYTKFKESIADSDVYFHDMYMKIF